MNQLRITKNPAKYNRQNWRQMPRSLRRRLRKEHGKQSAIDAARDYNNDKAMEAESQKRLVDHFMSLTVEELKKLLRLRQFKVSGTKAELVARLAQP